MQSHVAFFFSKAYPLLAYFYQYYIIGDPHKVYAGLKVYSACS